MSLYDAFEHRGDEVLGRQNAGATEDQAGAGRARVAQAMLLASYHQLASAKI